MSTKDYLKYYWLEADFLEKEVRLAFVENHFLTAEQFFAIVEWKVPRFGKIHLSYLRNDDIKQLTGEIYDAGSSKERRLEVLLKDSDGRNRRGIRLAMASAILTILYPTEFTVYDVRVRKQLRKCRLWLEDPDDITNDKNVVNKYLEKYLPSVKTVAQKNNLLLRDCDRALWAKDWHEDLQDFIGERNLPVENIRKCLCTIPWCAKCLSIHCEDDSCKIHTRTAKENWRRNNVKNKSVENSVGRNQKSIYK